MTDNRGTLLTVYFLSLVGVWSESDAANNLDFLIGESLPTSNLELAFGEPLQPLLLAQASARPV